MFFDDNFTRRKTKVRDHFLEYFYLPYTCCNNSSNTTKLQQEGKKLTPHMSSIICKRFV